MVVAGRHNMPAPEVGVVNPIFVKQDVVIPAATKAAIQYVIPALQGLPRTLADDHRSRSQLFPQYAKASNPGLGH
jgi:hypothetical protein